MHVIIWEYQVKVVQQTEFEKVYSPNGKWAELFKLGQGYLETELLQDTTNPNRYLTIDRWASKQDYDEFLFKWEQEYTTLDAHYDNLMEHEALLGVYDSV